MLTGSRFSRLNYATRSGRNGLRRLAPGGSDFPLLFPVQQTYLPYSALSMDYAVYTVYNK